MKKTFFLALFIIISVNLFSQTANFTDSLFVTELNQFLSSTYKVHPEVEQEYLKFAENWNNGQLEDKKGNIVSIANTLKTNRFKPYPNFYLYISTINTLVAKNDKNTYSEWETGLTNATNTKKSDNVANYLEFTNLLFKDSIVVKTPSVTWKVNTQDYKISNDPTSKVFSIQFNSDFDLLCRNSQGAIIDTFIIEKTTGVCYPAEKKFIGNNGTLSWRQADLNKDEVFATFKNYEIDMNKTSFSVGNAFFTNTNLGFKNIEGQLEVKLNQTRQKNISPIFESKERLIIPKFFSDLYFEGYIKMQGTDFKGTGKKEPAYIQINSDGKKIATLKSNNFSVQQGKMIYSGSADVEFYFNSLQDTITHPALTIRYKKELDSSLYDPQWFNLTENTGEFLILQRTSDGLGFSPFKDSYHNYNIYAEKAFWKKGDSLLYFITTKSSKVGYAVFESDNYFNEQEYEYFSGQNTDKLNHLAIVRKLQDSLDYITIEDYQRYLKSKYGRQLTFTTIEQTFVELAYSGFVNYNYYLKTIYPTNKVRRYLQYSARSRQRNAKFMDYDKISIISQIGTDGVKITNDGVNATMNLINNDFKITNVKPFKLAPTVKVFASEVTIQENHNMSFAGQVGSGLIKLTGTDFKFNYDKFTIDAEGAQAKMWTTDTVNGVIKYDSVSTGISDITGTIHINAPDNKSNTLDSLNYPQLVTTKKAKIYYDAFASKYGSGSIDTFNSQFYFEADNFAMDSLANITDSTLQIKGVMRTGLFDPLPVTLTVKVDSKGKKSLGFTECTGANPDLQNGLEFKDGKFFGCFELNDGGLFGNGYILYASSYVHSTNFAFMPDMVTGVVDTFDINEPSLVNTNQPEDIPLVKGTSVNFEWKDQMVFDKTNKSKMYIYSDKLDSPGDLKGTLTYTKNDMTGSGKFQFLDADITDTNFVFKNSNFSAQTCDFFLKVGQNTTFKTTNLNGNVDIDKKMGSFFSNDDTSRIVFEDNKYICIMDHFLWKIGEGIVNIGGVMPGQDTNQYATSLDDKIAQKKTNKDIKLFGTIMVGMVDTLTFNAAATTYKLKEGIIVADDVKEIKIADAMIYPMGEVTILKGGQIDTLKNIDFDFPYKIFKDTTKTDYLYSMHDAKVYIKNRFNYVAFNPKYYYKYLSQEIKFNNIKVDNGPTTIKSNTKIDFDALESVGTSTILAIDTFKLNHDFNFIGTGKINVYANQRFLEFEGYSRFDTTCNYEKIPIKDFRLDATFINPDTVLMPMSYSHKARSGNLETGLYWSVARVNNKKGVVIDYPFIGQLDGANTMNTNSAITWSIFKPKGFVGYNANAGEYRIGDKDLIFAKNTDTLPGNIMTYNKNLCLVRAQGKFDLFMPWDISGNKQVDDVIGNFKGFYRNDLSDDKQQFQGTWSIDFLAPDIILNSIINNCLDNVNNVATFQEDNIERIQKNYNVFLGKKVADNLFNQLQSEFDYDLPDSLNKTIVFSDVKLVYDADSSALVSVGDLGIASINGQKVDRYVKGYIKYRVNSRSRMLIIILEPAPGKMYAFKYSYIGSGGVLDIYSNTGNDNVDRYLSRAKDKDKKFKNYQWLDADEYEFKVYTKEYFQRR